MTEDSGTGQNKMPVKLKGSYVLVLYLSEDRLLTVGRLGAFQFPAGHYLYFGSALNGLEGRIRRHLRQEKKLHWHIDYLAAVADIEEVWWQSGAEREECAWAGKCLDLGGAVVAAGFGSSDCRCATHLFHTGSGTFLHRLRTALPVNKWTKQEGEFQEGQTQNSQSSTLRELT